LLDYGVIASSGRFKQLAYLGILVFRRHGESRWVDDIPARVSMTAEHVMVEAGRVVEIHCEMLGICKSVSAMLAASRVVTMRTL
jgi:hypothetical protein